MVQRKSVAIARAFSQKPGGKHRGVFLISSGVVAGAVLLFLTPLENRAFDIFPSIKGYRPPRGEKARVDVEPKPTSPSESKISDMISVFDGEESIFVTKKFEGRYYKVNTQDWSYSTKFKNGNTETGRWNQDWSYSTKFKNGNTET